jgi:hypothetical protein
VRLVAVDPGGQTGIAWTPDGTCLRGRTETWNLAAVSDPGRRYELLTKLLDQHWNAEQLIWEESPGAPSLAARRWHFGYLGVTQLWCVGNQVEFLSISPGTLKAFACGHGAAPKDAMRRAAVVYFQDEGLRDEERVSEHQIDALWLLAWGVAQVRRRK